MIENQVSIPEDFVISTCQTAIPAYRKGESEDIRVRLFVGILLMMMKREEKDLRMLSLIKTEVVEDSTL